MRLNKRNLHELQFTEIAKSWIIGLASGVRVLYTHTVSSIKQNMLYTIFILLLTMLGHKKSS